MIQNTFSMTTRKVDQHQLWKLMSNVDEWSSWDSSIEHAKLQGQFVSDSTFLLRPKGGPNVNIKLVDVQPCRYFKDQTSFPFARMTGEHWYDETSEGLKITITMTMTGALGWLWNKIVMKDIVCNLEGDIKTQIAEASKRYQLEPVE
jgi:hypothetical protein